MVHPDSNGLNDLQEGSRGATPDPRQHLDTSADDAEVGLQVVALVLAAGWWQVAGSRASVSGIHIHSWSSCAIKQS